MAIMPGAQWLNAATSTNMSRYDIVCIHTIVGYAPAHAAHFSTKWDGTIYQSRDTKYRSAANLNGNYRTIAIENEDHGSAFGSWNVNDGHAVPGFTSQQKEAIARILVWCYETHGIPLTMAPDSKPGSRGVAYHRQGIDGNFTGYGYGGRVAGGELWSNATGKVCPGDNRIWQLINEILPRARQLVGLETGGAFMALTDQQQTDMYNAIDGINRRVMGFLRQRGYKVNEDGSLTEVPWPSEGAKAAVSLDTLDGNYLVAKVEDAKDEAEKVGNEVAIVKAEIQSLKDSIETPEIDYDLLATKVAEKLSSLRFEANVPQA
jgi:hypothetical protein